MNWYKQAQKVMSLYIHQSEAFAKVVKEYNELKNNSDLDLLKMAQSELALSIVLRDYEDEDNSGESDPPWVILARRILFEEKESEKKDKSHG